jgi:uncharacterized protein (UPF0332 family)
MNRAREAIEEARVLLTANHANACVNRLYYACFYAVSALILTEGRSSSKHSGVRAIFDQEWVKPGHVPIELGRLYRRLFESRQQSDYADFVTFEVSTVSSWVDEAFHFVETVGTVIEDRA